MSSSYIGVVIDGESFFVNCCGRDRGKLSSNLNFALEEITRKISAITRSNPILHPDALYFFFPDPTDAAEKKVIPQSELQPTLEMLASIQPQWNVVKSKFKRVGGERKEVQKGKFEIVGGAWQATAEDVALANLCHKICATDELKGLGHDQNKNVTLRHVVIGTSENDHKSSLAMSSNGEQRWLYYQASVNTKSPSTIARYAEEHVVFIPSTLCVPYPEGWAGDNPGRRHSGGIAPDAGVGPARIHDHGVYPPGAHAQQQHGGALGHRGGGRGNPAPAVPRGRGQGAGHRVNPARGGGQNPGFGAQHRLAPNANPGPAFPRGRGQGAGHTAPARGGYNARAAPAVHRARGGGGVRGAGRPSGGGRVRGAGRF